MRFYKNKGQVTIEYLGVLMIFLLLLSIIFVDSFLLASEKNEDVNSVQLRITVEDLATNVNYICDRSEGSQKIILLPIPDGVNTADIDGNSIQFTIVTESRTNIVETSTDCTVTNGSIIPTASGRYQFKIAREKNLVNVTVLGE